MRTRSLCFDFLDCVQRQELTSWQFIYKELCKVGRYNDTLGEPSDNHRNRNVARPKFTFLTRQLNRKN
jgi:hypothetical protein